jgi:hypothetical protein
MNPAISWLMTEGEARKAAVEDAAAQLLSRYRARWSELVPIELHRLAASLGAEICRVKPFQEGARLIPVRGGFRVLISSALDSARYRTAIAHELVHTLFYSGEGDIPRRLSVLTKAEEHFCFDVARRVLAPRWMLNRLGVAALTDPGAIYKSLVEGCKLSRPAAARLMLEDYELVRGIAGRWSRRDGEWHLDPGRAYASPSLTARQRLPLREAAKRFLEEGPHSSSGLQVFKIAESSGESAFVVVAIQPPLATSHAHELCLSRSRRVVPELRGI